MRFDSEKIWKYYFYLYSLMMLLSPFILFGKSSGGWAGAFLFIQYVIRFLGWLALYGYVYGKRYLIRGFWIPFFVIELIAYSVSIGKPVFNLLSEFGSFEFFSKFFVLALIGVFLLSVIPLLIAHYRYIFTEKWSIKNA